MRMRMRLWASRHALQVENVRTTPSSGDLNVILILNLNFNAILMVALMVESIESMPLAFLAESFSHLRNSLGWLASLSAHLAAPPPKPPSSICNSKCSTDLRFIIPMKAETLLPWFLFHFFGFFYFHLPVSCVFFLFHFLVAQKTESLVRFRGELDDQEIKFNFIVAATPLTK